MATQAEAPVSKDRQTGRRKPANPFRGSIPVAVIGIIATIIGFLPTFWTRLSEVDVPHLLHGWIMTGWIVLVLTQALLIRSRRFKWHRTLGWSSLVLFVAMVVTSWQMIVLMLSGATLLPFEAAKFFAYSDILDMPLLIFFFCGAIYWRKDRHLHSRLMITTVLTSIVPALARMFNIMIWRSFEGLYHAMHPTYILVLGSLALLIYYDRKNNRLRWPLPLAFGWFSFVYATQWPMMDAAWYDSLSRSLAALA